MTSFPSNKSVSRSAQDVESLVHHEPRETVGPKHLGGFWRNRESVYRLKPGTALLRGHRTEVAENAFIGLSDEGLRQASIALLGIPVSVD